MRESENDYMNNCNPQNPKLGIGECYVQPFVGFNLNQNKSDLEYLSEWIDLKTEKSDETATLIIEKITEMLKQKNKRQYTF